MEIRHKENLCKDAISEKIIQEFKEELTRLSPRNEQIEEIVMAKVTYLLNSRIRHTHCARELLTRRNQFSEKNLEIDNKKVLDEQLERRKDEEHYKLGGGVFIKMSFQ